MDKLADKYAQEQRKLSEAILKNSSEKIQKLISPLGNLSAQEAITIYHNDYRARLINSLIENYSTTFLLFPKEFDKIIYEFIELFESRSYNLNLYGENLPQYIHSSAWMKIIPEIYDVINLELCFTKLFHSKGQSGLKSEELKALSLDEDLIIEFVDSLYLFNSKYPIYSWWKDKELNYRAPAAPFFIYKGGLERDINIFHLSFYQYQIMSSLISGQTLVDAIKNAQTEIDETKREEEVAALFSYLAQRRLIAGILH